MPDFGSVPQYIGTWLLGEKLGSGYSGMHTSNTHMLSAANAAAL